MAQSYEEWKKYVQKEIQVGRLMSSGKYVGLIAGIAGIADDMDPWKIGIGGVIYAIASLQESKALFGQNMLDRTIIQYHVDDSLAAKSGEIKKEVAGLKQEIAGAKSSIIRMKESIDDLVKDEKQ